MKCTIIFQCAVMCLMSQERQRLGAGAVLRCGEGGGTAQKRHRPQGGARELRGNYRDYRDRESSLVISLARQLVRQEEEIKVLRQDHALIFFMKPGDHNMLCHLYRTAQQFQKKQAENPAWTPGQQPLKAIMAVAVFNELGLRLDRACKEEDFAQKVKDLRWRDPAVGWRFQCWNPVVRHLGEDKTRKPITDQEVAAHLQKLTKLLLLLDLVHRFACAKRLTETMEGTAYKPEGFKPSPAIAKIKEMLRGR